MFATAPPIDSSLDDIPVVFELDEMPVDEGDLHYQVHDDRIWKGVVHAPGGTRMGASSNAFVKPKAVYVPFYRPIGAKAKPAGDVVGVKRALSRWANKAGHASWFPWQKVWTKTPGPIFIREIGHFQKRHNLPVTHVYDRKTHALLAPFFDAYGVKLLADYPHVTPQQRAIAEAMWGYHSRDRIHYAQWRPIDGHGQVRKLPLNTDCSGFGTDVYEWAKLTDPNGFDFNGFGFTGTMQVHGRKVSLVEAQPGDLAFYGWDSATGAYHHVTIVVSRTRCVSHGTEAGPSLLELGPPIGGTLHVIRRYI